MDNKKEKEFIKSEAKKLNKHTDIDYDSATEIIQSRISRVLDDRDILFFDEDPRKFITIQQLLDAGDKYNQIKFLEPLPTEGIVRTPGANETCWFKWDVLNPVIVGICNPYNKEFLYRFKRIEDINVANKFRFIKADRLSCPHPHWLIRDYIESEKTALVFGAPESFKSFMVIDMGLAIATGQDWHGHKVSQGPVHYICGEGQSGIQKRLMAWMQYYKQSADDFYLSSQPANILSGESLKDIETAVNNVSVNPKLIIIDTLNRNFGDGDENSTSDMTKFVQGIDQLSRRLKCAIIIIHHSGLADAGRSRGSSALRAAMDFEFSCKVNRSPGDMLITLRATKTKDHDRPDPIDFRPHVVQVGTGSGEEPITSVVLTKNSVPEKVRELPKSQKIALDALETVTANGDSSEEAWEAEAYAQGISEATDKDSKRKTFNRAKEKLISKGLVATTKGKYSIT